MDYFSYVQSIANLMPVPDTDPNFLAMIPDMISDAENRLYRELSLLAARDYVDGSTVAGDNSVSFDTFMLNPMRVSVWLPSGATSLANGTASPLMPASMESMDYMFPSASYSSHPIYFALDTNESLLVWPIPNAAYNFMIYGEVMPDQLEAGHPNTILTDFFPDLFIAASMVFASAYMKNFGAVVDDPQQGISWEQHLKTLMASAHTLEMRKKFQSQGWSAQEPNPIATPPRT